MHVVLEIIRNILLPLHPMLRARRAVLDFLRGFDAFLSYPEGYAQIANTPEGRAEFAAHIAFAEDGLNLLVAARTRELLGLPLNMGRWRTVATARARPMPNLMARYNRMRASVATIEARAQRRAARLAKELEQNPLRPDASHRSTSPAPCAVEATRRFIVQIASRSPKG
jgi:hypothetical protein